MDHDGVHGEQQNALDDEQVVGIHGADRLDRLLEQRPEIVLVEDSWWDRQRMGFVEDVIARDPRRVLEARRHRLPGLIEILLPVGRQPEIGIRRKRGRRQRRAPGVLRQRIPVRDADGRPSRRARVAEARTPAKPKVHVENDVEPVPVEHRHPAGDPFEVRPVDPAAHRLELGPIDAQTDDVEARALHQCGVRLVERRRRTLRVHHERVGVEAAEEHLSALLVDDPAAVRPQPGEPLVIGAVPGGRHRGGQAAGR